MLLFSSSDVLQKLVSSVPMANSLGRETFFNLLNKIYANVS